MRVVVKIGTSSVTSESGAIKDSAIASLCAQVSALRQGGHEVLVVSSGAVAGGVDALGLTERPSDTLTLQALAAVGLRGFEDVPCHTLSAGQQRRVALARLYLDAPPLWILDEPFTALDKQGVAQLEAHLAEHCERGGLVVLTTHHTLQQVPSGYRVLDLGQRRA